jgi:hypothetical protein
LAAADFAAAVFAAAAFADADRADAVRAELFAAAAFSAADFAAVVLAVVFPVVAFAGVFAAAADLALAARTDAARGEAAGFAALARAAVFFAAAARATAVGRASVDPDAFASGGSIIIFTAGSMITSPVGAAASAAAFKGFLGALFAAEGRRSVTGPRPPDVVSDGLSESSTWSVRSSGEEVTVLRYQCVASSQGLAQQMKTKG